MPLPCVFRYPEKAMSLATLLRRPEGTIKADLFAARARLKTALGERDG